MSGLLDCLESLAEAAADQGIPSLVICIRVDSDVEVDRLYEQLGTLVTPAVGNQDSPPADEFSGGEDLGIMQRVARTTVMGAKIIVSGPYRVQGRKAA